MATLNIYVNREQINTADRKARALRADPHGANQSLKTVGISHAPEALLPACSCHRLVPPLR
jgi:hypothetical protein